MLGNGLLWKEVTMTGAAEEQIRSLDSIAAALSAASGGPLLCLSAGMFLYASPKGWLSLRQACSHFSFFLEDFFKEKTCSNGAVEKRVFLQELKEVPTMPR